MANCPGTTLLSTVEGKERKLCRHALTFSRKHNILSFDVVVLQRTVKKCTKMKNARAEYCFCSLRLLLCRVLVAVAVVFTETPYLIARMPATCALRFHAPSNFGEPSIVFYYSFDNRMELSECNDLKVLSPV